MRLWKGPGWDRELDRAWGGKLQKALDTERTKLGAKTLSLGEAIRVHKGRLHCDFLLWLATRPEEQGGERAPAPGVDALGKAVMEALAFVAERSVERVAFPALGAGPEEVDSAERLATIVRAANVYAEQCFSEGRSAVVEEVIVCEPNASVLWSAKRKVSSLVSGTAPSVDEAPARSPFRKAPAKRRVTAARTRKKEPPKPVLSEQDIGTARATAGAYDMSRTYARGDSFIHPKFGVGRVFKVTQENAIEVVFEDRSIRKMVHGRG